MRIRIFAYDDYNGIVHSRGGGDESVGTVSQTWGATALRNGWKLIYVCED